MKKNMWLALSAVVAVTLFSGCDVLERLGIGSKKAEDKVVEIRLENSELLPAGSGGEVDGRPFCVYRIKWEDSSGCRPLKDQEIGGICIPCNGTREDDICPLKARISLAYDNAACLLTLDRYGPEEASGCYRECQPGYLIAPGYTFRGVE